MLIINLINILYKIYKYRFLFEPIEQNKNYKKLPFGLIKKKKL